MHDTLNEYLYAQPANTPNERADLATLINTSLRACRWQSNAL